MAVPTALFSYFLIFAVWFVPPINGLMPEDILKLYTNGTTMGFTANVTNCQGSKMAGVQSGISGSFLGGVTSAGSVHSESHNTWFLRFGSEKLLRGHPYKLKESVVRLTSLSLDEDGGVYVNDYDLDSITGKILAYNNYFCSVGQSKPEVTFIPDMKKRSTLMTYDDVMDALLSGRRVTFSVNVDGDRPDAFRYWFGQIKDYETDLDNNIVFTVMVPALGYKSVFNAHIGQNNHVSMDTFTVNTTSQTMSDNLYYEDTITEKGYFRIYV